MIQQGRIETESDSVSAALWERAALQEWKKLKLGIKGQKKCLGTRQGTNTSRASVFDTLQTELGLSSLLPQEAPFVSSGLPLGEGSQAGGQGGAENTGKSCARFFES